jgi:hypothetical protein
VAYRGDHEGVQIATFERGCMGIDRGNASPSPIQHENAQRHGMTRHTLQCRTLYRLMGW